MERGKRSYVLQDLGTEGLCGLVERQTKGVPLLQDWDVLLMDAVIGATVRGVARRCNIDLPPRAVPSFQPAPAPEVERTSLKLRRAEPQTEPEEPVFSRLFRGRAPRR